MDGSRIILAAHRGDKFNYPENTIPAFESAISLGVDMIETDVRMSKDGELVLIHDKSTLRTTGVDKNIDEMLLSEIKKGVKIQFYAFLFIKLVTKADTE